MQTAGQETPTKRVVGTPPPGSVGIEWAEADYVGVRWAFAPDLSKFVQPQCLQSPAKARCVNNASFNGGDDFLGSARERPMLASLGA